MTNQAPPKLALKLLRWYCKPERLEELEGDLYEAFQLKIHKSGRSWAKIVYWFMVVRSFRSYAIRKEKNPYQVNFITMSQNNLKIAIRNFTKNPGYGTINLAGLVLGLTSCLLIALHVVNELSYDRFHLDADRIYRIQMDRYEEREQLFQSAVTYPAVAPAVAHEIPEVEEVLRIMPFGTGIYTYEDDSGNKKSFNEERSVFSDSNFFSLLNFNLVKGSPDDVLKGPNKIVLSESTARKYFNDQDPIGKILVWRGNRNFEVTGVMEDFPSNSHMNFDMIISLSSWPGYNNFPENWGWYDFYTFVKVKPGVNNETLNSRLTDLIGRYTADQVEDLGQWETLSLQPLTEIHLYSKLSWDMGDNGGGQMVYFLMVIAICILIVAWVNFINLASARAVRRAREVGIRKVVGATKKQLVRQFLFESFLYNLTAFVISIAATLLAIPFISQYLDLHLNGYHILTAEFLVAIAGVLLLGSIISGLYPAFLLTSYKPVDVLKGKKSQAIGSNLFRKILVLTQFIVSLVLIAGTILVMRQLNFMKSRDLGIEIKKTLVLNTPTSISDRQDLINRVRLLRNEVDKIPDIKSFSISSTLPGRENFNIGGFALKSRPDEVKDLYRVAVGYNFMDEFKIEFLTGRNFSPDFPSDSNAVILNQMAVKHLLIPDPDAALKEIIPLRQREYHIIGVIKDYHQESLKKELGPVIYFLNRDVGRFISLKLESDNYSAAINKVRDRWKEVFPDSPFDYYILEDQFARQYRSDEQFNIIFTFFSGLTIFVTCLGLLGLISTISEENKREISIRKVLGSSPGDIVQLIARNFLMLILIAVVIGIPVGYLLMDWWLNAFPYQTSIGADIFVFSIVITFLITSLTISYHTIKAVRTNPAEILRTE